MKKSRFTLTGVCFALILSMFVFGCDSTPPVERNLQEEIAALTNQSSWAEFHRVNDLLRAEQAAENFNLAELQARANELRARVVSKVAAETLFTPFYVAGTILERFRDGNRIVFAYPSTLPHITITPPPGWVIIYDGEPGIDVEVNSEGRVLIFNIGNEMAVVGGNHLVTPVRIELVFEHASRLTANFDFTYDADTLPEGFYVEYNIGIEFAPAGLFHGQPAILPLSGGSATFVARFNNLSATLVQITDGERVAPPTVRFYPDSVTFATMGNRVEVEIDER